jgi:hypothetical protein
MKESQESVHQQYQCTEHVDCIRIFIIVIDL